MPSAVGGEPDLREKILIANFVEDQSLAGFRFLRANRQWRIQKHRRLVFLILQRQKISRSAFDAVDARFEHSLPCGKLERNVDLHLARCLRLNTRNHQRQKHTENCNYSIDFHVASPNSSFGSTIAASFINATVPRKGAQGKRFPTQRRKGVKLRPQRRNLLTLRLGFAPLRETPLCSCVMSRDAQNITELLVGYGRGDKEALDQLMPIVYEELRRQAARYLRREQAGHTLQTTALIHEAYVRLVDQRNVQWQNRAHFFGIAAQMMRRILVDHARTKKRAKRGGSDVRVSLAEATIAAKDQELDVVALDEALERLAQLDEQQSRVVELRFFSGLTVEETAEVLGISKATVKRDWSMAKAWLHRELSGKIDKDE